MAEATERRAGRITRILAPGILPACAWSVASQRQSNRLSKVCRTESNPSRLIWTPWIAAAAQRLRLALYRRSPNQSAKKEQTSLPASREKPVKKRPTSPLAFHAASRFRVSRQLNMTQCGGKTAVCKRRALRCRRRSPRTTSMGSGCHANPLVVTQLRRRSHVACVSQHSHNNMTLLLEGIALVLTESLDIIPRHICSCTLVTCPMPTFKARTAGSLMLWHSVNSFILMVHLSQLEVQVPACPCRPLDNLHRACRSC